MEFRVDRTAFAEAVGRAARALPARTPVPVLGGLLLEATAGRLSVAGFDFEAAVRVEVDAGTTVDGRVLVPGRRLLDVCRVLPDGPVSCALEASRFTVEAGGTRFGLSTLPLAEYPALPAPPSPYGTVDAAAFATAVAQVAVAAGRDDTLPLLTGVQLRLDGKEMTLAASDRYRYAVRRLEWSPGAAVGGVVDAGPPTAMAADGGARTGQPAAVPSHGGAQAGLHLTVTSVGSATTGPPTTVTPDRSATTGSLEAVAGGRVGAGQPAALSPDGNVTAGQPGAAAAGGVVDALLPARRLLDVARSLGRCGDVRIGWDAAGGSGLIGFEGGETRTVLRLLEGRLPTYRSLFDTAGAAVAEVECEGLTEAVRRVAVVAEANSPVRLDFSADGSVLLRAGYGDDVAAQRLPATLNGADEVTVAFNPAYLLDALTSFESPRVRLELLGAGQRALLHAVPDDGTAVTHRHLLMSVKQLV